MVPARLKRGTSGVRSWIGERGMVSGETAQAFEWMIVEFLSLSIPLVQLASQFFLLLNHLPLLLTLE